MIRQLRFTFTFLGAVAVLGFLLGQQASSQAVQGRRPDAEWRLYLRHFGPFRIGMTTDQVRSLLRDPTAPLITYVDPESDGTPCAYMDSEEIPDGIGFMFSLGKLVRVDVNAHGVFTASGIEVGDSEEKVFRTYPDQIRSDPHYYRPETGHYLIFVPMDQEDAGYGLLFETDRGTVTSFRAGLAGPVSLVEGCY